MTTTDVEPWTIADPAALLATMDGQRRFRPGEVRAAVVDDASTAGRLLGQVTVVRDGRRIARAAARRDLNAIYRAQDLLDTVVDGLPVPRWCFDGVPTSTVVLVSARYGRVVPMADEWVWERALLFCNGLHAFKGPALLVTEHGWFEPDSGACGRVPSLAPPSPRRVSAASTTSSSRAGSG